jgi:hypothetical protein
MKRYGYLFDKVTSFDNLLLAAQKAMRGQRAKPAVARFYFNLENELLQLQDELASGTYQPQPYRVFWIYEPKKRQICAAPIRDRVVHHAVCHLLDPIFERQMIYDTYACRRDKGTHAAVRRAQQFARRYRYFLQCDIRHYFASIDHEILKNMLRRLLKDARVLDLLNRAIDQPVPASPAGKGLPIGNLTSQYFANLYLSHLDHYLKEQERVGGYLRYMDDFLLFGNDRRQLAELRPRSENFLADELKLTMKLPAPVALPTHGGISFLGFRVFPALVRVQYAKLTRFRRRVKMLENEYLTGNLSERELACSLNSMAGHIQHANTLAARQAVFA